MNELIVSFVSIYVSCRLSCRPNGFCHSEGNSIVCVINTLQNRVSYWMTKPVRTTT
jgi:hypothetical protein